MLMQILIKYTLFLGTLLKALSKEFHPCPSILHCSVCIMCAVIFFVLVLNPLFIVVEEFQPLVLDSKWCLRNPHSRVKI